MLGQIESSNGERRAVIADLEAGLGTITRMAAGSLDLVLLVINPSVKSIEAGVRGRQLIAERNIGAEIVVIANRLRSEADLAAIAAAAPDLKLVAIPEDPAIVSADIRARSPVDEAPGSPVVQALMALAGSWAGPSLALSGQEI